jgi:hypothetical protein
LHWGAFYNTPDIDLQVSLLIDFVNHLYDVCVRWKFVPDPRTFEIRDAIRRRGSIRTCKDAFRMLELLKETLIQVWSNFRRLGFCESSDFSSLGVGVDVFADYFSASVQRPTASEHVNGFYFRHIDLVECFSAF